MTHLSGRTCIHDPPGDTARALLLDIVRCPMVGEAGTTNHPCSEIVRFQGRVFPDNEWQPPTPWVGHIEIAPILFLGSNPNIGGNEHYPDSAWRDDDIVDYFDAAFDGHTGQIADGTKARQSNGRYGRAVRTWSGIRKRAEELLERPAEPGVDYAMAEIVHCRSHHEIGVDEARDLCADRYLERTLAVSAARIVVAFGAHNRRWLSRRFGLGEGDVHQLDGTLMAFMPHPTSWGPKTFAQVLSTDDLARLRQVLVD